MSLFIIPFITAALFLGVMSILKLKVPAFSRWIDDNGERKSRWCHHPLGSFPVIKQNFITAGIIIVFGLMFSTIFYYQGTAHVMHNEVWNYKIVEIQHWEKWTTEESRQVRYQCGTDKDGNAEYCYRTEYYTETHGPYWYAIDESGRKNSINSSEYDKWKRTWQNEKVIGHNRGSSAGWNRSISGDILSCKWTGEFEEMFPWHSINSYENRVRGSHSIFRTMEPTEKMLAKWKRPADLRDSSPIFGFGVNVAGEDSLFMKRINCLLGPVHQVHTLIYLFDSSEYGSSITDEVLSAWDGPNKNEIIIFIGIDKNNNVDWIRVESWSDNTKLHGMIESSFSNTQFRVRSLGTYIQTNIGGNWKRKEFKDFEYIQIKISFWWYFSEVIVCLVGGIGAVIFCKFVLS